MTSGTGARRSTRRSAGHPTARAKSRSEIKKLMNQLKFTDDVEEVPANAGEWVMRYFEEWMDIKEILKKDHEKLYKTMVKEDKERP